MEPGLSRKKAVLLGSQGLREDSFCFLPAARVSFTAASEQPPGGRPTRWIQSLSCGDCRVEVPQALLTAANPLVKFFSDVLWGMMPG
jgi:hypothetical protein